MDERTKQALMIAILVFNVVVILFQLVFNIGESFDPLKLLLGVVIGAAVGGVTFVVAKKMNN